MYKSLAHFMNNEDGATAIEYALIAVATGLALIVTMPSIGEGVQELLAPLGIALAAGAS
ncbi:MAG: Flp family type IVb pilin [Pseudomonadota bacterium]